MSTVQIQTLLAARPTLKQLFTESHPAKTRTSMQLRQVKKAIDAHIGPNSAFQAAVDGLLAPLVEAGKAWQAPTGGMAFADPADEQHFVDEINEAGLEEVQLSHPRFDVDDVDTFGLETPLTPQQVGLLIAIGIIRDPEDAPAAEAAELVK